MIQINTKLSRDDVTEIESLFLAAGLNEEEVKSGMDKLGNILCVDFYEEDPLQPGIRFAACAECFYYECGICGKYGGKVNPNTLGNDCFRDVERQKSYAICYDDVFVIGPVVNADENGNYDDDFSEVTKSELAEAVKRLSPDQYEEYTSDPSYDENLWSVKD